jgi:hypothetical protein
MFCISEESNLDVIVSQNIISQDLTQEENHPQDFDESQHDKWLMLHSNT